MANTEQNGALIRMEKRLALVEEENKKLSLWKERHQATAEAKDKDLEELEVLVKGKDGRGGIDRHLDQIRTSIRILWLGLTASAVLITIASNWKALPWN